MKRNQDKEAKLHRKRHLNTGVPTCTSFYVFDRSVFMDPILQDCMHGGALTITERRVYM